MFVSFGNKEMMTRAPRIELMELTGMSLVACRRIFLGAVRSFRVAWLNLKESIKMRHPFVASHCVQPLLRRATAGPHFEHSHRERQARSQISFDRASCHQSS